jgi:hypothetical protein
LKEGFIREERAFPKIVDECRMRFDELDYVANGAMRKRPPLEALVDSNGVEFRETRPPDADAAAEAAGRKAQ